MNTIKAKNLIISLYLKGLELRNEAYCCSLSNDNQNERDLIVEAIELSKRVSFYEVLVSSFDVNKKINIRPMSCMERLENRINLTV